MGSWNNLLVIMARFAVENNFTSESFPFPDVSENFAPCRILQNSPKFPPSVEITTSNSKIHGKAQTERDTPPVPVQGTDKISGEDTDGSFFDSLLSYVPSLSPNRNGTLLEKAAIFRKEHPDKWEKRVQERNKRFNPDFLSIDEKDAFLTSYYDRLDKHAEEKKMQEQNRKLQSPKLVVDLMFTLPNETIECVDPTDSYESLFENFTTFSKDFLLPFGRSDEIGKGLDFYITVKKGKNLLNRLKQESHKYEACKLKCSFHSNVGKANQTFNTKYVYVNNHGKTRWNHVFIIKGYTMEELACSYVMLQVKAKSRDGNDKVGSAVLSGMNASIRMNDSFRPPRDTETVYWHNATHIPGANIHATIDLVSSNPSERTDGNSSSFSSLFNMRTAS